MSLFALAEADDSDSDFNNSEDESESKKDGLDQNLKRETGEVFDKERTEEMTNREDLLKEEYGECEATIGGQLMQGASTKREPKEEYGEISPGGHFCKRELKVELKEEKDAEKPKVEYGEIDADMEQQKPQVSLKRKVKEEYGEFDEEVGREQPLDELDMFARRNSKLRWGWETGEQDQIDPDSYNISDIVAGREMIGFITFKGLVESGRLTREDLSAMRSVRVLEVPGVGEVIQYLSPQYPYLHEFNKIDLKELKLDEVCEWKSKTEQKHSQTWTKVSEMFSKKGTSFICNPCQTVHTHVKSALKHIVTIHAKDGWEGWKGGPGSSQAKNCLVHMCDPSLVFQKVRILNEETMRKYLKSEETNIYEKAAELLSNVVSVKWDKVARRGGLEYKCKICDDFTVVVNNGRAFQRMLKRSMQPRSKFTKHLTDAHPSNCQSLAAQLGVAPGKKLYSLLFEALMPNLHDVWSKMAKLHRE